jgi:hypothetical protein
MFPRRCKKCQCYIAPHLDKCPRCGKASPKPIAAAKQTKEEKRIARTKRDAKVPVIHAKNMHWVPSEFSMATNTAMLDELQRRFAKEETAQGRNTVRGEIRSVKAHLARAIVPDGKHAWTSEIFRTKKAGCIYLFISPKKHKYVTAERDGEADLLITPRKKHRDMGLLRLRRFEKSPYARMVKTEAQEDKQHEKRRKVKKEHRAKKRKHKPA